MNAKKLVGSVWNHPAGPRTIHFWAPTFKWAISATNILNFSVPPDSISYPQQAAFVVAGFIGARYCTVITPKNWNLFSNNFALGCTGIYQLARKAKHEKLLI
ncbi:mitochondrial pyruvate carrier 4-like [Primulina huaijiensis]|uniref:mitochondrial pyruvate carrier 4-like n=1 Tax=Primulina huaijiensis TaxID=1492673 RepID=UPI003CC77A00